jgi:hypothetical protein
MLLPNMETGKEKKENATENLKHSKSFLANQPFEVQSSSKLNLKMHVAY